MLDAIERQRLERRWAFLIMCAIACVIAALVLVALLLVPGVDGVDSSASAPEQRGKEDVSLQPPPQSSGRDEIQQGTLGRGVGGAK